MRLDRIAKWAIRAAIVIDLAVAIPVLVCARTFSHVALGVVYLCFAVALGSLPPIPRSSRDKS